MEYGRYDLSVLTKSSLSIKKQSRHSRWGACFLFVDGDLQTGLELDHGSILVDNDLADELSHHALVELGDISLLIFQEILQLILFCRSFWILAEASAFSFSSRSRKISSAMAS